ncbi:hypothetical protein M422DRAFT_247078 [Sphaerobolus stellatus SS14]|nr:hypothetical protein M422DRAFT_247078 [Sphaerobolus stellatus SS14]
MSRIPELDLNRLICGACGTQFEGPNPPCRCHICDDPRQYVPPSGQSWTNLKEMQGKYHNIIEAIPDSDENIFSIITEPKFPIGQRTFLIRTPKGNILWDLIALIDEETFRSLQGYFQIEKLGGIKAIVISHPHFYTTFATRSYAFGNIPVYIASDEQRWISRPNVLESFILRLITSPTQEILSESGVTAIKAGGHFPGSIVLHWKNRLFAPDTLYVTPSGLYDIDRQPGTTSFAFMWSYPNQIPLPPEAITSVIKAILPFDFDIAHAVFNEDVNRNAKKAVESAEIIKRILAGIQYGDRSPKEFWK